MDPYRIFDNANLQHLFPGARLSDLQRHFPLVVEALHERDLTDKLILVAALGTIRAETAGFKPIDEMVSHYNTAPGGKPFGLYDDRHDLGNQGHPDGIEYRGRGFVQLTGRDNYRRIGQMVDQPLELVPRLANEPKIAAQILAAFLQTCADKLRGYLLAGNLLKARRAVNGGAHGIVQFTGTVLKADQLCEDSSCALGQIGRAHHELTI